MFDKPGLFYSNSPGDVIFDNDWVLDNNKIQNLKQHKLVVLDCSSEHYGVDGLEYIYNKLDQLEVNFLLLSHHPGDHKKFSRMFFYPWWYHWSKQNFVTVKNQSTTRSYKWSCLNGNPRAHRIYNYFYSQQQSYYNSAYFSFYNSDPYRADDVKLPDDVVTFWENIKHTLPNRNSIHVGIRPDAQCDLPAIIDSYVHLVTETTVIPKIFVSEKTWKPIANAQLFLIFGNPGTVGYLRDMGVDVFDDIIDHSYDSIDNWQARLHAIHHQLEKLINQNIESVFQATQARRVDNATRFFSGDFDCQYKNTIEQSIIDILDNHSSTSK